MSVMKSALVLLLVSLAVADELNSDSKSTEKFTPNNGIALCEEVKVDDYCGPNAKCIDYDNDNTYSNEESLHCRCLDGVSGQPPNCGGCKTDKSCSKNEYCDEKTKTCMPGCHDASCPPDHYCDLSNRECKSGCVLDNQCDEDKYCNKADHQCTKGCRAHKCHDSQFCDSKSRQCKDGCERSDKCNSDEFCHQDDHQCKNICKTHKCSANSVCRAVDRRKHCTCEDGYVPRPGQGCVRAKGEIGKFNGNCREFCGLNADCKEENGKISCSCIGREDNPFVNCTRTDQQLSVDGPGDDMSIVLSKECIGSLCFG